MKNKLMALLLVLAMTLSLTACGTKASEGPKDSTATPQATEIPENESLRIVSFSPSITEIICALGAKDYLVARTDYCDYPAEVSSIESIGDFYNPDIEKVVSLEPDYVLASALWTEDVANKFTEAGIETRTYEEIYKVDSVYSLILEIAKTIGKEEEANKIIEGMKKDLASIEENVQSLETKSVYYVVGYGEYGDYTATGETYINDMITLAGGDNIAKDITGWTYSLESLIEEDPEIIFIGEYMKDDFINNPNYQNLSAVKNSQVYGIDNNLLDRQTNRTVEGIRILAQYIHPDAFR